MYSVQYADTNNVELSTGSTPVRLQLYNLLMDIAEAFMDLYNIQRSGKSLKIPFIFFCFSPIDL